MITRLAVGLFVLSTFLTAQVPVAPILEFGLYDEITGIWAWTPEPSMDSNVPYFRMRIHAPVGYWVGIVAHAIPDGTLSGNEEKAQILRNANAFARPIAMTGMAFAPYLTGTNLISIESETALAGQNFTMRVNPLLMKKEIQGFSGDGLSTAGNARANAVKGYGIEMGSGSPASGAGYPSGFCVLEWRSDFENWGTYTRNVAASTHYQANTSELWSTRLALNHPTLENRVFSSALLAQALLRDQADLLFPGSTTFADSVFQASLDYGFKLSFHAIALDPPTGGAAIPPQFRPVAVDAAAINDTTRGADSWRNTPPQTPFPPGFTMSAPTVLVFLGHPPLDGNNYFRIPVAPWLPLAFYGERLESMVFHHANALQIDTMLMPDMFGGLIPVAVLDRLGCGIPLLADELAIKVPEDAGVIGYAYGWNSVTNTLVWPFVPLPGQNPVPDAGLLFYDGSPLW